MNRMVETLQELEPGFAFVGRQVHFCVDGDDFYIDFPFFHDNGEGSVAMDAVDPHNRWWTLHQSGRLWLDTPVNTTVISVGLRLSSRRLLAIQLAGQSDENLERRFAVATSKESMNTFSVKVAETTD